LPKPRIHKRVYQRIRVDGRDFTLGKPGSQQADERYKTILAAWAEGGGRLPDDFQLESESAKNKSLKPIKHSPDPGQICVADLLCAAFVEVEEKSWRWYLLRRVAVCLEPYANLPAIEFGPRLFGQVVETMATTRMRATRNGEQVPPTKNYVREVSREIKRLFSAAVASEELPPERLVALNSLKKLPIKGARGSKRVKPAKLDIVEATCAVLPPVFADLIRFIMLTGCRPSEATAMTPAMIDMTAKPWILQPAHHKNSHRYEEEDDQQRLFGIDTPELGQPFGNNAKQALSGMVFGKSVTISSTGKDRYGRTLGTVFSQDKGNLNAELIHMGMAWHYRRYSNSTAMQGFEDYAKENKIGLWADKNPIAPWDWRKGKR